VRFGNTCVHIKEKSGKENVMNWKHVIAAVLTLSVAVSLFGYPGSVVESYETPYGFSTGMTYDGEHLWIADYKADKLIAVNPSTGEQVREIPSPGFWPMGLAWDGTHLWNLDRAQGKIFQVDPDDGTILNTLGAPGSDPQGLVWDGTTLWVSDAGEDALMMIDMSDGTAVRRHPAPANAPHGLTYDGTYLWCTDRMQDELHMIDPSTGQVMLVTDSPGPYPRGLAWDGNHLWNVDFETDSLYQLIREDDEHYRLDNTRAARVTVTHEVTPYGNGTMQQLDVYLAIPGDLPQQTVKNITFTPEDYATVTDQWDQEFAHFAYTDKTAGTTVRSKMVVDTEISDIHYYIFPDQCGTLDDIPAEIAETYTANGGKYRLDDPFIRKTAEELAGGKTNPYWIAREVFDYVRKTLEYELVGGWNTAPVVLQRGTGSCSEYTFSFIALCRAAGVPARYVGSIVVRGDDASLDEVFHRWPEVYLPNYGWVPMDPQGGDDPLPRDRAMNIGHLPNRFLITTASGGNSDYLGWYYNAFEEYVLDPQVKVNVETFGEWEPKK